MNELLTQLTSILTDTSGSLVYHIVLVFSITGALQIAVSHWQSTRFPQLRRTIIGLSVLLVGQLILFIASAMSWQALIDPFFILPPLDRALSLFSLIWIAWLWVFPEPSRPTDAGLALLNILLFTGLALSYTAWSPHINTQGYNSSIQDIVWQSSSLVFIAIAGVFLIFRRPNGWSRGVSFMLLIFVGHSLYLLFGSVSGNFSGITRLFYFAAFPILLSLPHRFPGSAPPLASHSTPTVVRQDDSLFLERRRYSTDPKTFHALLSLASAVEADEINNSITRAIAQTMLADLSFLIYLNEDGNQMILASGYDLIREENLDGFNLSKETIPMLANALQSGRPLRLPQSSTSPDLKGLGELLSLENPGHLLSTPIIQKGKKAIGGVLLLSPYSNRLWNADDQSFLANISESLVPIIERGQRLDQIKRKKERSEEVSEEYRQQIASLRDEKNSLSLELEKIEKERILEKESGEDEKWDEKVAALLALQAETQLEIAKLQKENDELRERSKIETNEKFSEIKSAGAKHVEKELRATLQEVAVLQNQQAKANLRILELENESSKEDPSEQAAVIASVSQELRQPMSSIVGYTDLLLGESVGILGALQRKFVERIKASIERIGNLIDDLIQVSTLELGLTELKAESVDLNMIIDNAMEYTNSQAREKNISINLEVPRVLPSIHADRDALQQILIHLLQNAGAASPVDGNVTLKVNKHEEESQDFILIQVSDTGGGIPSEDIPRVFSRLYRAENVLIQGVGDTGVGLSIAKALTEAQQGRIWVEAKEGVGATFSVLLPIFANAVNES